MYFLPQCLLGPKEWLQHQEQSLEHSRYSAHVCQINVQRPVLKIIGQGLIRRKNPLRIRISNSFRGPERRWAAWGEDSGLPVSGSIQAGGNVSSGVLSVPLCLCICTAEQGGFRELQPRAGVAGWTPMTGLELSEPCMGQKYPYLCSHIHVGAERKAGPADPSGLHGVTTGCRGLSHGPAHTKTVEIRGHSWTSSAKLPSSDSFPPFSV